MSVFHEPGYLAHNKARLDHLASLNLTLSHLNVLELGAGIGDHTQFFLDQDCEVTVSDGRAKNVMMLKTRYPQLDVRLIDVEQNMAFPEGDLFDVVYCYGLLYHTKNPFDVLERISGWGDTLLLETCVSPGASYSHDEDPADSRCALHGKGSRPSRRHLWEHLRSLYSYVYMPLTQPRHAEFPLDWNAKQEGECRAMFIASNYQITRPQLVQELPMLQYEHI